MAVNHRVVVNTGSLPFVAYPIQLTTTTPFVVNYDVSSTGGVIRSLGKRIYDTNVLAANGTVTVQPNTTLTFPFITTQLPINYFDAVFLLTVNSNRYIQGFSNSPDNVTPYTSNYFLEDKKMFGIFLKCYGVSGQTGNYDTVNHYMLGGENSTLNNDCAINMVFDAPTPTPVTMSLALTFYTGGIVAPTLTRPSAIVPAGSTSFTFPLFNLNSEYRNTAGYNTISQSGYYKVEIVPSDPSYVSILPFYHFGQFG